MKDLINELEALAEKIKCKNSMGFMPTDLSAPSKIKEALNAIISRAKSSVGKEAEKCCSTCIYDKTSEEPCMTCQGYSNHVLRTHGYIHSKERWEKTKRLL